MPKFIKLTPMSSDCKTVYINRDAIERLIDHGDYTQITFIGTDSSWTNVKESAETVVKLAEES